MPPKLRENRSRRQTFSPSPPRSLRPSRSSNASGRSSLSVTRAAPSRSRGRASGPSSSTSGSSRRSRTRSPSPPPSPQPRSSRGRRSTVSSGPSGIGTSGRPSRAQTSTVGTSPQTGSQSARRRSSRVRTSALNVPRSNSTVHSTSPQTSYIPSSSTASRSRSRSPRASPGSSTATSRTLRPRTAQAQAPAPVVRRRTRRQTRTPSPPLFPGSSRSSNASGSSNSSRSRGRSSLPAATTDTSRRRVSMIPSSTSSTSGNSTRSRTRSPSPAPSRVTTRRSGTGISGRSSRASGRSTLSVTFAPNMQRSNTTLRPPSPPSGPSPQTHFPRSRSRSPQSSPGTSTRTLRSLRPRPSRSPIRPTVRRRSSLSDAEIAQMFENTDLDLNDNSDFDSLDDFKHALAIVMEPKDGKGECMFKPGTRTFLKVFDRGEHLFQNRKVKLRTFQNGREFENGKGSFKDVYLVKNKAGLGMEVPDDLDFGTLKDYMNIENEVKAHNEMIPDSNPRHKRIGEILHLMNDQGDRKVAWNVLSLEFSNTHCRLRDVFKMPSHVEENSMVHQIETALREKLERISDKLNHRNLSEREMRKLEKEKAFCEMKKSLMPNYHRFLLISMKGSFTNVHIDFGATSVFYHVIKGKKIFYVAPATKRNMEIYRKHETAQGGGRWIGEEIFEEFQRVEICEGETAWLPAGYLHFVYTPEDSLVVGGNFLSTDTLDKHFELTSLEEESVNAKIIGTPNMFNAFFNVMWAYVDDVLLPKLADTVLSDDATLTAARIFLKMVPGKQITWYKNWYSVKQKEKIREKLDDAVERVVENRRNQGIQSGSVSRRRRG